MGQVVQATVDGAVGSLKGGYVFAVGVGNALVGGISRGEGRQKQQLVYLLRVALFKRTDSGSIPILAWAVLLPLIWMKATN